MLISRANLAVGDIASTNEKLPGISRIHLAGDGTTVAANEHILMAVSPVNPGAGAVFPLVESGEASPPEEGIGLPLGLVKDTRRNMPNDLRFQYAKVTRCDGEAVGLMTTDGISKDEATAIPMRGRFPDWEEILVETRKKATRGRICVNGKQLIELIQAMMKACPDRGNLNPIWIEFGARDEPLYVRALNRATGQTAIAQVSPIDTAGHWIRTSIWEKGILAKFGRMVKRIVKG